MTLLPLPLGLLVGAILGLTGAGGSVIAVPLLMATMGWSLPQASPVALLAVAAAALIGTVEAWRKGLVRYRAATLMSVVGVTTTPLGLAAAQALPPSVLMMIFAGVLATVGVRMFRQARHAPGDAAVVRGRATGVAGEPVCRLSPETGRISWTSPCAAALAATGALTGFLSGLLGVGGGFVIVPSLRRATELTMHGAVATSLMVITLTSTGAIVSALLMHRVGHAAVAVPFVTGSVAGMLLGRLLAPRLSGAQLQMGFSALLWLIAAGMARHALLGGA